MYIRRNTQATLTKPTAPGRPTPRVAPLAFLATRVACGAAGVNLGPQRQRRNCGAGAGKRPNPLDQPQDFICRRLDKEGLVCGG